MALRKISRIIVWCFLSAFIAHAEPATMPEVMVLKLSGLVRLNQNQSVAELDKLPDGSSLTLNANATLDLAVYAEKKIVRITGPATVTIKQGLCIVSGGTQKMTAIPPALASLQLPSRTIKAAYIAKNNGASIQLLEPRQGSTVAMPTQLVWRSASHGSIRLILKIDQNAKQQLLFSGDCSLLHGENADTHHFHLTEKNLPNQPMASYPWAVESASHSFAPQDSYFYLESIEQRAQIEKLMWEETLNEEEILLAEQILRNSGFWQDAAILQERRSLIQLHMH